MSNRHDNGSNWPRDTREEPEAGEQREERLRLDQDTMPLAAQRVPLAPGEQVGAYSVVRMLGTAGMNRNYLAHAAAAEPGGVEVLVQLVERPKGAHDAIKPLLALDLQHPHLLVPRELISMSDRDMLIVESAMDGETPTSATEARPPLDAAGALAAGVALAEALTYLHRKGVAHLRVSPSAVTVREGQAYLGGLEDAQIVHPFDQAAPPLFARDANFLARTLGVLAGVVEEAPRRSEPTVTALGAIVARGAANEYRTTEEVGSACTAALPRTEVILPSPAPAAEGRLSFVAASATSVGRVRSENQDAAALAIFDVTDDVSTGRPGPLPASLLLVADGMGGEERGELASRIAARVVVNEFIHGLLRPATQTAVDAALVGQSSADAVIPTVAEVLAHAAHSANDLVRRLALNLGKATGTTLTAVGIAGGRAALAHVGDSRAYLLRGGELTQLSEDHTLLARLQSMNHPLLQDPAFAVPRNYLYRSLGQDEESEPDIVEFSVSPGDRILLCSDGLWDEVDPETLHSLLSSGENPHQCAQALVAAADASGGHDNSTAVVAFVEMPG